MWEWVSDTFGPMGWFTDSERAFYYGTDEFKDGYWRPVTNEEVEKHRKWANELAREQN